MRAGTARDCMRRCVSTDTRPRPAWTSCSSQARMWRSSRCSERGRHGMDPARPAWDEIRHSTGTNPKCKESTHPVLSSMRPLFNMAASMTIVFLPKRSSAKTSSSQTAIVTESCS